MTLVKNMLWGRLGIPKVAKSDGGLLQNKLLGIRIRKPADLPDPADLPETVSAAAARTLPTTRAGGRDDGS